MRILVLALCKICSHTATNVHLGFCTTLFSTTCSASCSDIFYLYTYIKSFVRLYLAEGNN